jgi:hypothetical protein
MIIEMFAKDMLQHLIQLIILQITVVIVVIIVEVIILTMEIGGLGVEDARVNVLDFLQETIDGFKKMR